MGEIQNGSLRESGGSSSLCTNIDEWRPPTWASHFLHSWDCCWCCCRVALTCFSRLSTSRWCSWTRLSFSVLCCCCSRVLSCSCCERCSAIWLDKQAKRDFISQHTLRATLSSWQLVHLAIRSTFLCLTPATQDLRPKHPTAQVQPSCWMGKTAGKNKSFSTSLRTVLRYVYIWLAPPPSHLSCKLYRPRIPHSLLANRSLFAYSVFST